MQSQWTSALNHRMNLDGSYSWKGTHRNPPQTSAVALYIYGISNYASLKQYVDMVCAITDGLIFVKPARNQYGQMQGTATFQWKTKAQCNLVKSEIQRGRGYGIGGKLIAVKQSVYEYNVKHTELSRDGRIFLSDPSGSDYFMRPMIGLGVEWYTNPWITYGTVDDNHNNGQASDLCRIGHPDDPLMWVATGNDYLKENSYSPNCKAWIEMKKHNPTMIEMENHWGTCQPE